MNVVFAKKVRRKIKLSRMKCSTMQRTDANEEKRKKSKSQIQLAEKLHKIETMTKCRKNCSQNHI